MNIRVAMLLAISTLSLAAHAWAAPRLAVEVVDVRGLPVLELQFVVRDDAGKPMGGLRSEDFRITLDGESIPALSVAPAALASERAVCVVLEASARLRGRDFFQVRNLVAEIADRLAPGDRLALVTVSDTARTASELSPDRAGFKQALADLSLGADSIVLHAALARALEILGSSPEPNRAVILLATGQGVADGGLKDIVLAQARELRIPLHSFAAGLRFEGTELPAFAELTGGRFYPEPSSPNATDLVQRALSGGSGRYSARVALPSALDGRPHHAVLELFLLGQSVNQEFSFLMSPGSGIAPDAMNEYFRRAAARQSWWMVYFGAVAGGLAGAWLRDRIGLRETFPRVAALAAALVFGALLGFVLSRMAGG